MARYNTNGTLDNSYGTNGVTKVSLGGLSGEGYSAVLTTDGKLLVGGNAGTAIALMRLDASGKPDATFGNNGVVISDLDLAADQETVHTLLLRPDGKILACGSINEPNFHPFCVQFTADGDKDDTFDAAGANLSSYLMNDLSLIRMALKPDGKVVLSIFTNDFHFNILQLTNSGQPDMGFGKSGRANAAFDSDSRAVDVAILPDDRVLVLGGIDNCIELFNDNIVLTRFSSDGKPDVTFGVQGKISDSPTPAGKNYPGKLSLQADGKILVTNAYAEVPGNFKFTLLRYLPEGARDSAFGTNGVVFFNGTNRSYAPDVIEQPDGKILFLVNLLESASSNAVLYRLLPSGAIDSTFATNGALKIDVSSGHGLGLALALQPDGKIIVAGNFQKPGNSANYDIFIHRYLPDGTPDNSFGASGRAVPALASIDTNPVSAILLQPDGKLLLNGQIKYSSSSGGHNLLLLRFTPNGILDQSFGIDGVVTTDWYENEYFSDLALQPDGRIVACGSGWLTPTNDFYTNYAQKSLLIRYNQDGSPDNTFGFDGHSSGYFNSDGMFYYSSVALQSSGRIVAAGAAIRGYTLNLGIAGFAPGIVDSPEAREGNLEARISPNPTKGLLRVEYTLENSLSCTLGIYDVNGNLIRSVFSGTIKPAGLHQENIALADLSAGLYFVRLETGARVFAGKFLKD